MQRPEPRSRLPALAIHDIDLEVAVLADVQVHANVYWKQWLWKRPTATCEPEGAFCTALAIRFAVTESKVRECWAHWYEVTTSWEYAAALCGGTDLREIARQHAGRSHRRCPG
ncbi:MAG TPA: hypothetical protein VIG32_06655 [Candidatus Baltobacteraceae bacterium]